MHQRHSYYNDATPWHTTTEEEVHCDMDSGSGTCNGSVADLSRAGEYSLSCYSHARVHWTEQVYSTSGRGSMLLLRFVAGCHLG